MAELLTCSCGGTPDIIKLFEKGRPDCYIKCSQCKRETKAYRSRQNAAKAWNTRALKETHGNAR